MYGGVCLVSTPNNQRRLSLNILDSRSCRPSGASHLSPSQVGFAASSSRNGTTNLTGCTE
ncbi:uncharacterized protein N7525_010336 [Penicillium rubens]|uniref:uncharacterized protein n=1 Tax=Penicillium rubens TaxID=1108849 RepID=UPI002A5A062C|nr:uncharacterized protein N7525_010336 [Penicillium rubens]KAJ5821052.1 hypothetical protein N7525_010336 [Penicillium rubens]KAJ5858703.1 hypothetical protein N7534_003980 [Penicillium rubens]